MAITDALPYEDQMSSLRTFTENGLPKRARLKRTTLPSMSSWYLDSDLESEQEGDPGDEDVDDDSEFENPGESSDSEKEILGEKRRRRAPKSSISGAAYGLASGVERCPPQTAAEFALASLETTPVATAIVPAATLDAAEAEKGMGEGKGEDRDQSNPSSPIEVDMQAVVAATAPTQATAAPTTADSQDEQQQQSDHNLQHQQQQQQQQQPSLTNKAQQRSTATLPRKKWIRVPHEAGKRSGASESSEGRAKTFVCMECGKGFSKACKLARHAMMHTGERPFACPEEGCSKAFTTKDKLKRHSVTHVRRKAGLSTSGSNNARREADHRMEAKHLGLSVGKDADGASKGEGVMPSTLVTTLMEKEMAMSINSKQSSDVGGVNGKEAGGDVIGWKNTCGDCGRTFQDKYHLRRHIKSIHEAPRMYKCDVEVADDSADGDEGAISGSSMPVVGSVGKGGSGMAVDSSQEPGAKADGVGSVLEANVDVPGRVPLTMLKVKTRTCGAAFAKKWQLREHLFHVHGATKFNCRQLRCPHPGCGRVFDRASKLAAHEKSHTARFRCEYEGCGKAFVLASGLNCHLREEHPYRCTVCDILFKREDKLQEHMGTHQRAGDGGFVRPYACTVPGCGKAFTEKRNLNAHRRTWHTEGGRKRFKCEVPGCDMAFAHRHTLIKHVKREHPGAAAAASLSSSTLPSKANGSGTKSTPEDKSPA